MESILAGDEARSSGDCGSVARLFLFFSPSSVRPDND